jgi:hypothetical protein
MPLIRDNDGSYRLDLEDGEAGRFPPSYAEALPRYLTLLDQAFTQAKEASQFWFVLALLRVRGSQDSGWDPYETTVAGMEAIRDHAATLTSFSLQRHLHLWTYGHLVEASESYEIAFNMISISQGGSFAPDCFPRRNGRSPTPGEKIEQIESAANASGFPALAAPFRERWDRRLRNAIFHADYSLHGSEVRIRNPVRRYTGDEFLLLLNRAAACHDAIRHLHRAHAASYSEPVLVTVPPEFSRDPEVLGQVIVRQGEGLAAIRAAWMTEPRGPGQRIHWHLGRFLPGERELLEQDPSRLILPAHTRRSESHQT